MEIFPALKLLPRRTTLCLYLLCATFATCAFYTLYLDSRNSAVTRLQQVPVASSEFHSENAPYLLGELKFPSPKFAPLRMQKNEPTNIYSVGSNSAASPGVATGNRNRLLAAHAGGSVNNISVHSKTSRLTNTRYVYISNISTSSRSATSTSAAYDVLSGKTTTPPVSDTCQTSSSKDTKLILLWTPFFEFWNYLPNERFDKCRRCRNCRVTTDRRKLPQSDAVIFHCRDMSLADLPPVRYSRQRWVFYCLESPAYSDFPGLDHVRNMFNWTMTYRADSDITAQYGTFTKIHPSRKLDLNSLQSSFNNKSKSVVWMSSHCPTHSMRDLYAEELKKFIDVDLYGSCGTSICPPEATEKCHQEFADKYKFFLAFENALCKDYITEKFFRTLKYNIVPVVFGGASYRKFAPPGSFVDALSFKSPKHLAFFLTGVARDFNMYKTYFRWRKDYSVKLSNSKECDLCSLLHKKDVKPSSYANLRDWWVGKSRCWAWKPKR